MQKRKIVKIILRILVLLLFLGLPAVFFTHKKREVLGFILATPVYWLFGVLFSLLFFLNLYYLVPKFYLQKKHLEYAGLVLLLLTVFFFLKPFDLLLKRYFEYFNLYEGRIRPYDPFEVDIFSCIIFVIVILVGIAIQVIRQWRHSEKKTLIAEADKVNAELSFLKAQVNPHFLFNTLNNIYSLSVVQDPKTSLSIMKLSNLMRYIADDSTNKFVNLEQEVACIRDYIDLQKLRLGENIRLEFTVTGDISEKQIAPLILMSFVENVFKYGVTTREPATITIRLVSDAGKITFFCQNRIFVHQHRVETTGIGLSNTRRRLELVYPGKYDLQIDDAGGLFTVALTLQL